VTSQLARKWYWLFGLLGLIAVVRAGSLRADDSPGSLIWLGVAVLLWAAFLVGRNQDRDRSAKPR
jgi:hypothetical protein